MQQPAKTKKADGTSAATTYYFFPVEIAKPGAPRHGGHKTCNVNQ